MWKAVGVSVLCCCWQRVWAKAGTPAVFELTAKAVSGGPRRNMV